MNRTLRILTVCSASLFALPALAVDAPVTADTATYQSLVRPFLQQHCTDCHGSDDPEGQAKNRRVEVTVALPTVVVPPPVTPHAAEPEVKTP